MSNSFRVGAITAAMNFQTGGFMAGVREVVQATSGIRTAMQSTSTATVASTAAMSAGLKAMATQAGLTSGAMGLLGKEVAAMATAANLSVAGTIAKFIGMRSAAVAAARELDQVNRAANANRVRALNSDARITTSVLSTGNEAAAMEALTSNLSGLTATAGKAALGIGAVAIAGTLVAKSLKPAIDASLEFEHSFAFVRKTVDGTKEQLDAMAESIQNMALRIPISVKELNGVAAAAGQLGIAREDIVNFTEVMAGMGIATDLTAEQAAVALAQWSNITGMAAEDVDNLASTIVYLGNNTATTESQIVNMSLRLAGASRVVGLTNADMAGLSASLASLGIWAESGGNAMSRTMYDMQKAVSSGSDELKLFAAIAGKSADEFSAQFKSAPMAAVVDFVGGIAAAGKDANSVLEQLGITEMESQRALIGLAGGHDKLAKNVHDSNAAFRDATALGKEVNTLYGTGVSKAQLLTNAMSKLATTIGDDLRPQYDGLIGSITSFVNLLIDADSWIKKVGKTNDEYRARFQPFDYSYLGTAPGESAKPRTSEDAILNNILKIQKVGYVVKQTTADVDLMNKALASAKFKDDIADMKDLVPTDVFKRAADKAIEIFKAVPDEVTKEMRSAKFADMYRDSRDGFKSVAEAAKMIPAEYRDEFISAANVVESELAKKGKSGGRKLADEAGKEFERAMEEAVKFRLDLFPAESFADDVQKIIKMAKTFPETLTDAAVSKAFDDLLTRFEGKGVDAVKAIKDNLVDIAPEFLKEMENAVSRAKTASLEAMMEARATADDETHWSKVGDFRGRGKDRLADIMDPAGIASMAKDTQALTVHLQELVDAGSMDSTGRDSILSLDYWDQFKELAGAGFDSVLARIQDAIKAGQEIPKVALEALGGSAWKEMGDQISGVGDKLRDLGASKIGAAVQGFGRLWSVGQDLLKNIKSMPSLFTAMEGAGVATAIKIGIAMHFALNVIALIADAVTLVISLFSDWGDEGVKELKGMAKVIDEIKEASDQWVDSLTDKLVDAIKTGQFAWRDFVNEILDDLASIAIKNLILNPIVDYAGSFLKLADGGAFDKGHIVNSPEFFATKSGLAVRGEAGTEVVMPAVRMGDGTLGVKGAGGGSPAPIININDYRSNDSPPIEVTHRRSPNGQDIYDIVINAVNKAAAVGDLDRALNLTQMRRGGY